MTIFQVSVTLQDAYGRKTRKRYETEDISDIDIGTEYTTARAAAASLVGNLAALSEADILYYSVQEEITYTDTPDAGANIDEGITLVATKADNKQGILKVPAPLNSVLNADGTVDLTDALVTAYVAEFQAGGEFTFSDGEKVIVLVSGRLDK